MGTLPFGAINVVAMNISVYEGLKNAVLFAFGAIIIESVFVYISIIGIHFIQRRLGLIKIINRLSLSILLVLTVLSFWGIFYPSNNTGNAMLENTLPRFIFGMLMGAINPAQIPFWLGWNAILISKDILIDNKNINSVYILGTALGTTIGLLFFIYGGQLGMHWILKNQIIFKWMVAIIFLIASVIQFIKMFKKPIHKTS